MKKAQEVRHAQFSQAVDLAAVCIFIARIATKEKREIPKLKD